MERAAKYSQRYYTAGNLVNKSLQALLLFVNNIGAIGPVDCLITNRGPDRNNFQYINT